MNKQALIIIDLQNDYFPDGKWPLHDIESVKNNAEVVLSYARQQDYLIIHVHHEFLEEDAPFFIPNTIGAEIHPSMTPKKNEIRVLKHQVNAFHHTNLKSLLEKHEVKELTLIGAMSHMCIDSAARSAFDHGFGVTVIADACASRDLEFDGVTVPATAVHAAYMSALDFAFATVTTTQAYTS